MIAALMIEGRTFIPAVLIAMTHGDELALPAPVTSPGSLNGTLWLGRVFAEDLHEAYHECAADVY